jgi:antirestriction protein
MDQGVLNLVIMTVGSVFGWVLRMLWTASQELKADLAKLREELPKDYVSKDDYRQDVKELKDMISKLFDILEKRRST